METQYKTGDGVKQYKHPKLGWIATLEATEGPMNGVYTMDITASGRPEWKVFVPEELLALGFEEIKQPEIPEWIEKAHEEFIPFRDKKSFISCILKHLPPSPKITIEEIKKNSVHWHGKQIISLDTLELILRGKGLLEPTK